LHLLRHKDKELKDEDELKAILSEAKYVTVAISLGD
jgi:hypothetical protein